MSELRDEKKRETICMEPKVGVCHIVGAGPAPATLAPAPGSDDLVIAADGGLRTLEAAGIRPEVIVGDFDTLGYVPEGEHVIKLNVEKDETDTFVAMGIGFEKGYRKFLLHGCVGGRLEHTIANLQHLAWLAQRGAQGWVVDDTQAVTAIKGPATLAFKEEAEGFISIFSFDQKAKGVTLSELKYTLDKGCLENCFPLGVSNEFLGRPATIELEQGILLVVVPRDALSWIF